jgi:hypothetical protein
MKLWVAPESNKTLTRLSLIENVLMSTEAPSEMSLMVVKFSLSWQTCTIVFLAGLAGLCSRTLILLVGLVLLGFGAITHIVPRLTTIETAAITDVTWGCTRLVSLLLSVAELEVP